MRTEINIDPVTGKPTSSWTGPSGTHADYLRLTQEPAQPPDPRNSQTEDLLKQLQVASLQTAQVEAGARAQAAKTGKLPAYETAQMGERIQRLMGAVENATQGHEANIKERRQYVASGKGADYEQALSAIATGPVPTPEEKKKAINKAYDNLDKELAEHREQALVWALQMSAQQPSEAGQKAAPGPPGAAYTALLRRPQ
jgi:hypothetical protein